MMWLKDNFKGYFALLGKYNFQLSMIVIFTISFLLLTSKNISCTEMARSLAKEDRGLAILNLCNEISRNKNFKFNELTEIKDEFIKKAIDELKKKTTNGVLTKGTLEALEGEELSIKKIKNELTAMLRLLREAKQKLESSEKNATSTKKSESKTQRTVSMDQKTLQSVTEIVCQNIKIETSTDITEDLVLKKLEELKSNSKIGGLTSAAIEHLINNPGSINKIIEELKRRKKQEELEKEKSTVEKLKSLHSRTKSSVTYQPSKTLPEDRKKIILKILSKSSLSREIQSTNLNKESVEKFLQENPKIKTVLIKAGISESEINNIPNNPLLIKRLKKENEEFFSKEQSKRNPELDLGKISAISSRRNSISKDEESPKETNTTTIETYGDYSDDQNSISLNDDEKTITSGLSTEDFSVSLYSPQENKEKKIQSIESLDCNEFVKLPHDKSKLQKKRSSIKKKLNQRRQQPPKETSLAKSTFAFADQKEKEDAINLACKLIKINLGANINEEFVKRELLEELPQKKHTFGTTTNMSFKALAENIESIKIIVSKLKAIQKEELVATRNPPKTKSKKRIVKNKVESKKKQRSAKQKTDSNFENLSPEQQQLVAAQFLSQKLNNLRLRVSATKENRERIDNLLEERMSYTEYIEHVIKESHLRGEECEKKVKKLYEEFSSFQEKISKKDLVYDEENLKTIPKKIQRSIENVRKSFIENSLRGKKILQKFGIATPIQKKEKKQEIQPESKENQENLGDKNLDENRDKTVIPVRLDQNNTIYVTIYLDSKKDTD